MTDELPLEPWNIPPELVERWTSIDADLPLIIPINRHVIDHLFFAIFHTLDAAAASQVAVQHMSAGRTEDAAASITSGTESTRVALDRLRRFMGNLMELAQVAQ